MHKIISNVVVCGIRFINNALTIEWFTIYKNVNSQQQDNPTGLDLSRKKIQTILVIQ